MYSRQDVPNTTRNKEFNKINLRTLRGTSYSKYDYNMETVRTANTWIHSYNEDINLQKRNLRDLKLLKIKNATKEKIKIDDVYSSIGCNRITNGQLDQL